MSLCGLFGKGGAVQGVKNRLFLAQQMRSSQLFNDFFFSNLRFRSTTLLT